MVRREMAGDGRSTANREMAAEANDGEGAPVRVGRGEVVWELRGLTAELARVSARAEELRRGGFDGGVELAGVLWMAAVAFCELGAESEREEEGKLIRDSSRCWGARELAVRGAAAGSPPRRRGGDRADGSGWRGEAGRAQREERRAARSFCATRGS